MYVLEKILWYIVLALVLLLALVLGGIAVVTGLQSGRELVLFLGLVAAVLMGLAAGSVGKPIFELADCGMPGRAAVGYGFLAGICTFALPAAELISP